ncbi:MAG: biotin--[acetyl-CoA-carboxylase] ligase [Herminiimonas sp.]|nr:biotin--[acetyl-CoA-carboxylase] ligase [Herminiimonas sp.]
MTIFITPDAISLSCRSAASAAVDIDVVAETKSTNADLLARACALQHPTLLVALAQTAGRGRAGRNWQSDADSLTFSLAWPLRHAVTTLLGLPLAIGVAVADVLAARGVRVALKWPNDILLEGRKLAGILIETTGGNAVERQAWAVIGIGINLRKATAADDAIDTLLPASAALPATDRNVLLAELLDALMATLQQFEESGFAPSVARWNALHAHAGRQVDIVDQGRILHSGAALGVDASGRLLLDTGAQVVPIVAGDVSLRVSQKAPHAAAD